MNKTKLCAFAARLVSCCTLVFLAPRGWAQCDHPWQTMGEVPGVFGYVTAMTEWDPDGPGPLPSVLVVGGAIQAAGSRLVNNIATWDGQTWSTLGAGLPSSSMNGPVTCLLVHDGELFA